MSHAWGFRVPCKMYSHHLNLAVFWFLPCWYWYWYWYRFWYCFTVCFTCSIAVWNHWTNCNRRHVFWSRHIWSAQPKPHTYCVHFLFSAGLPHFESVVPWTLTVATQANAVPCARRSLVRLTRQLDCKFKKYPLGVSFPSGVGFGKWGWLNRLILFD